MTTFTVVGNTQVIALTTTPSTTALTNTSASHFLMQNDTTGQAVRVKFGTASTTVTAATDGTAGVILVGQTEGVIMSRDRLQTHIAAVASTGTPNLFITPVIPG